MTKVLISAGHSMTDPGACANGLKEAVLALELRDKIYNLLVAKKINVLRDGDDGINQPLRKAIKLAEISDLAIELHFNAGQSTATGIEALAKIKHKAAAQALCQAIGSVLSIPIRGDKGWKADNSGQHHRLGFCEAGGIILEVAFITSKKDMDWYTKRVDEVAKKLADAIVELLK